MSKIQIETTIDTDSFVLGAANLQLSELEKLVRELDAVIVRKKSLAKDLKERELIRLINQTVLDADQRSRYLVLVDKLENSSISSEEHLEFLSLTEKDEKLRNERLSYLIELAQLNNLSLLELMERMGLIQD
ncbi:hypothetical protein [Haliscomenobacter sp.]|uniref:hypothetical protein n=1 Tax=Haliscomenobacter sp. TaxID=2717303 RepID=UPI0035932033